MPALTVPAGDTLLHALDTPGGEPSVAHLRENIAGAGLSLSDEDVAELDRIGR